MTLLRNALRQSGWRGEMPSDDSWTRIVGERLAAVDFARARQDVRPVLEPGAHIDLIDRTSLDHLLRRR